MKTLTQLLKESPDSIDLYDEEGKFISSLDAFSEDAFAFGYTKKHGHTIVSEKENTHFDMLYGNNLNKFDLKTLKNYGYSANQGRFQFDYPGRVWVNHKIISFWQYPDSSDLKKIINQINDVFKNAKKSYRIDNNWRIEIIVDSNGNYGKKFFDKLKKSMENSGYNSKNIFPFINQFNSKSIVIPLPDYIGSEERSAKELAQAHVLSPLLKKPRKVHLHPFFKQVEKAGMTAAEYRHKTTKYQYTENKNFDN